MQQQKSSKTQKINHYVTQESLDKIEENKLCDLFLNKIVTPVLKKSQKTINVFEQKSFTEPFDVDDIERGYKTYDHLTLLQFGIVNDRLPFDMDTKENLYTQCQLYIDQLDNLFPDENFKEQKKAAPQIQDMLSILNDDLAIDSYEIDEKNSGIINEAFEDVSDAFNDALCGDNCFYNASQAKKYAKTQINKANLNLFNKTALEKTPDDYKVIRDKNMILEEVSDNLTIVRMLGEDGIAKIEKGITLIEEHMKLEHGIDKDIRDEFCACEQYGDVCTYDLHVEAQEVPLQTYAEEEHLFSSAEQNKKPDNILSIKNQLKGGY